MRAIVRKGENGLLVLVELFDGFWHYDGESTCYKTNAKTLAELAAFHCWQLVQVIDAPVHATPSAPVADAHATPSALEEYVVVQISCGDVGLYKDGKWVTSCTNAAWKIAFLTCGKPCIVKSRNVNARPTAWPQTLQELLEQEAK